jgi:DNA-binding MarR family transcriptional regulator
MRQRATPAVDDAVFDLADRLHSVAIHTLRRVRREDTAAGLPAPQLSALSVIVFGGPLTMSALAAAEQVRPPTMTRVVAALEALGLVSRSTDAEDRRITMLSATKEGRRTLEEGRRRRIAALAAELSRLGARELAAVRRGVDALEPVVGPRHAPARRRVP